jgi:Ca2+-binding EF-hand superfamily protein
VRKEGRHFRRGPSTLSSEEVERLVKLGDKVDQALYERKRKREQLKSAFKKFQEEFRKFVDDKLADDVHSLRFLGYTSLQKELQDLGLDITKSHTNPLDKEE